LLRYLCSSLLLILPRIEGQVISRAAVPLGWRWIGAGVSCRLRPCWQIPRSLLSLRIWYNLGGGERLDVGAWLLVECLGLSRPCLVCKNWGGCRKLTLRASAGWCGSPLNGWIIQRLLASIAMPVYSEWHLDKMRTRGRSSRWIRERCLGSWTALLCTASSGGARREKEPALSTEHRAQMTGCVERGDPVRLKFRNSCFCNGLGGRIPQYCSCVCSRCR
jgi:hypothetical protein